LSKQHADSRSRGQRHDGVVLDLLPPTARQESTLEQPRCVLIESSSRAGDPRVQLATLFDRVSSIAGCVKHENRP
jgi:hypothetical protein